MVHLIVRLLFDAFGLVGDVEVLQVPKPHETLLVDEHRVGRGGDGVPGVVARQRLDAEVGPGMVLTHAPR